MLEHLDTTEAQVQRDPQDQLVQQAMVDPDQRDLKDTKEQTEEAMLVQREIWVFLVIMVGLIIL